MWDLPGPGLEPVSPALWPAGFLNKVTTPCPNSSPLDLLASCAASSTSLDSVTGWWAILRGIRASLPSRLGFAGRRRRAVLTSCWGRHGPWPRKGWAGLVGEYPGPARAEAAGGTLSSRLGEPLEDAEHDWSSLLRRIPVATAARRGRQVTGSS